MSPQSYCAVPKQTFKSLSFFFFIHLKAMCTSQARWLRPAIPELGVLHQEDCEFQTNLNYRGKDNLKAWFSTPLVLLCTTLLISLPALCSHEDPGSCVIGSTLVPLHVSQRPWINACPSGLDIIPCWWGDWEKGVSRLSWRTLFSQGEGASGKGKARLCGSLGWWCRRQAISRGRAEQ